MGKKKEARDQTARELRDVAVRGLLGKLPGNWPIIADLGLHIMGKDTDAALAKGKDYLGNVMSGYWKRMGEDPARATYSRLTEKANPKQQAGSVQSGRPRPEDTFFNPGGDVLLKSTQDLKARGWRRGFYENPEMTAEAIGATTAAAPLLAGGALLSSIAAGNKPRSRYSYPVEPDRGGYDPEVNPNVEAANVSFQNQAALEEQKFRHHMALQAAREQARIPGPQNTSVGSYGGGPYSSGDLMSMAQGIANQKYKFG